MEKKYILHKWLNGEPVSSKELELLKSTPEYASYLKIAEATTHFTTPAFNSEANFNAISNRIKGETQKVRKLNPFVSIMKIAAVLAIIFMGYQFISGLDTTINTQVAHKETLVLPDNSEVIINANSTLAFNKRKWKKKRELSLQGEAFFKVTKGEKFDVKTPQGVVSVLGTQFNVFSRENTFTVTCYEGLVQVSLKDTIIKVPAGNRLQTKNGKYLSFSQVNVKAPEWIVQKESRFENALLSEVIKELERQYPIKVTVAPNNLLSKHFTGSFTHTNLEVALQTICKPLQLKFTIKDSQVSIYAK